jgi:nucleoside 2-deoxyribosyltransferase
MLKIYLAAGYSRKYEIRERAKELSELGVHVTSTWLQEPHDPNHQMGELTPENYREIAETDVKDILRAGAFALFTQDPTVPFVRGGRMVEFGIALATGKLVCVIGPQENIFTYLPQVEVFATWEEFKERMRLDADKENFEDSIPAF